MRTGIFITLKPADRRRLAALARDRNAPHKHVWRAEIVLLSADGVGTNEIMRQTGKSKTCVWRWQERFMQAGYAGHRMTFFLRAGALFILADEAGVRAIVSRAIFNLNRD